MGQVASGEADLRRLVIGQPPRALVLCAPDDAVILWSAGASATFGDAEAQALGRRLGDLIDVRGIDRPAGPFRVAAAAWLCRADPLIAVLTALLAASKKLAGCPTPA